MHSDIQKMEKKIRVKKMDAHKDEMTLQKLKLMDKIKKLDDEIKIAEEQIEELQKEIGE